jgi:hypothetical protein
VGLLSREETLKDPAPFGDVGESTACWLMWCLSWLHSFSAFDEVHQVLYAAVHAVLPLAHGRLRWFKTVRVYRLEGRSMSGVILNQVLAD